jgi:hypothetical protein
MSNISNHSITPPPLPPRQPRIVSKRIQNSDVIERTAHPSEDVRSTSGAASSTVPAPTPLVRPRTLSKPKCQFCKQPFKANETTKSHNCASRTAPNNQFSCSTCGEGHGFSSLDALIAHQRTPAHIQKQQQQNSATAAASTSSSATPAPRAKPPNPRSAHPASNTVPSVSTHAAGSESSKKSRGSTSTHNKHRTSKHGSSSSSKRKKDKQD